MSCSHLDKRCPGAHHPGVKAMIRPEIVTTLWTLAAAIGCGSSRTPTVLSLSAGDKHVCAILSDSSTRCWGSNAFGQLGDDGFKDSSTPATVLQLPPARVVAAGLDHNCAILTDGSVQCWGGNGKGQLGDASLSNRSIAGKFVGLAGRAIAIASGNQFSCAAIENGSVQCWGSNDCGQLGLGSNSVSESGPVSVMGLEGNAVQISAGNRHACALLGGGKLQCWGCNEYGQTGAGVLSSASFMPVTVPVNGQVTGVAAGGDHTCALLDDGSVDCWGSGAQGALGTGQNTDQPSPQRVTGLSGRATDLAAGSVDSCTVNENASLQCWGSNSDGQLGDDASAGSAIPVDVAGRADVAEVTVGATRVCVRHADSTVDCWGEAPVGRISF